MHNLFLPKIIAYSDVSVMYPPSPPPPPSLSMPVGMNIPHGSREWW